MKKILLAVALMIGACTFVACNGSSNASEATTDSVEVVVVDSLAVDSVAADSVVADSVVADTVVCSCEG